MFQENKNANGFSTPEQFMKLLAGGKFCLPFDTTTGSYVELVDLQKTDPISVEWRTASGQGILLGKAVYHRQYHPKFPTPYAIGMVALEEGPVLMARLGGEPKLYTNGMQLTAEVAPGCIAFVPSDESHPNGTAETEATNSNEEI